MASDDHDAAALAARLRAALAVVDALLPLARRLLVHEVGVWLARADARITAAEGLRREEAHHGQE